MGCKCVVSRERSSWMTGGLGASGAGGRWPGCVGIMGAGMRGREDCAKRECLLLNELWPGYYIVSDDGLEQNGRLSKKTGRMVQRCSIDGRRAGDKQATKKEGGYDWPKTTQRSFVPEPKNAVTKAQRDGVTEDLGKVEERSELSGS
jgi:hypothetical protein